MTEHHVPAPPSTARPAATTAGCNASDDRITSGRQKQQLATVGSGGGGMSCDRRHVSARVAPSNGNMFTRFMKTSNGANVCQPQPRAEGHALVDTTMDGTAIVLNPMKPERSEPRRQIGVLCNTMTKLDMVALAHQVVPAVSLGSPRFELDPPAKLGEERYDYKKHAMATTKIVERADAALGLRANVSVVFYQTNPGALTSRRDFKLLTVPNHRDIKESLAHLEYAKKAPRCANHVTANFEPSSSDDEDNHLADAASKKKKKHAHRASNAKQQPPALGVDGAPANAQQLQPLARSGSNAALKKNAAAATDVLLTPNGGSILPIPTDVLGKRGDGSLRSAAHTHAKECVCVHCTYVREELDKFDRAMDPSSSGKRGKAGKRTAPAATARTGGVKDSANSSSPGASPLRNEKLRQFLSAPAFAAPPPAHNPASPAPVVVPLLQQLMVLQSALAWVRGLEPIVHARTRAAILTAFPNLKQDCDVVTSSRARRMTLAEFLRLMMLPPPTTTDTEGGCVVISPSKRVLRLDDGTPRTERFALPQRPVYGNHHVAKLLTDSTVGGGGSAAPSDTPLQQPITSPVSPQLLAQVRPWEEFFAFFDTTASGHCDRFLLLLPILAATSHHVFLEPESLKYDSRQYSHLGTLVVVLSTILRSRRPSDGPVRLGETFAIKDFLQCDLAAARALAISEGTAWIAGPTAQPLPKRRRQQLMGSLDNAVTRIDDFASKAKNLAERQELLDATQLASLLQETLLL